VILFSKSTYWRILGRNELVDFLHIQYTDLLTPITTRRPMQCGPGSKKSKSMRIRDPKHCFNHLFTASLLVLFFGLLE
jgi:hypothetical protein